MLKKYFSILFIAAIFVGCKPIKPPTAKDMIRNIVRFYSAHKSVSYSATYKVKTFNNDAPYIYNVRCSQIRDNKDSLFGGYLWHSCSNYGGFENYYNLNKIYYFMDSAKTITVYNNPKSQYWAMTGNTSDGANNIYFLKPLKLSDILKDSTITDSLSIDKIDYTDYWKLTIKYPNNSGLSERWKEIWIDRRDTSLKKIYSHVVYQQQEETEECDIDSMVFDKVTSAMLEQRLKNKMKIYKVTQYVPPGPDAYKLLDSGTVAPLFTGEDFQTGKPFSADQYKGKVLLLDFWYMSCPWCIKAMPAIEKAESTYQAKGLVVLGINSHDTSARAKKRLPVFMSINKMNYTVVLTSHKTDSLFKIKGYPTLYIINKKGKVALTHLGYSANLDSLLNAIIPKELEAK